MMEDKELIIVFITLIPFIILCALMFWHEIKE